MWYIVINICIFTNDRCGEESDRLKKLGRTAYEKEIDGQLQELKNNTLGS